MGTPSVKLNYLLNTVYQMLSFAVPLVTTPYISRVLGADGVGVCSFTTAIMQFFSLFAVLGTTTYGQRAIARCRDDKADRSRTFWEIETLRLGATALCLLAWFVFIGFSEKYRFFYAILSLELVSYGFDLTWFYGGLEKFVHVVVRNLVVKLSGIVLLFVCVKDHGDIWLYLLITSASFLLGNLSMWLTLPPLICKPEPKEWAFKIHLKESMAYFIPTIAASVYLYIDKIMLNKITGSPAENGYYEQATKILRVGYTVIVSLNTVMTSRMSYLFAQNKLDEVKKRLEKSLSFIFLLGFPMCFGMVAISRNFVPWFFGAGFSQVAVLLILGSPLILAMSMHNFLAAQYLVPSGQRVRSTKGIVIGACVNFLLNLLLIPKFRAVGALVATVGAEFSIFLVYLAMSLDYLPVRVLFRCMTKPVVASSVMFFPVWLVGRHVSGSAAMTGLQIAVAVAVYFSLLLLLREQLVFEYGGAMVRKIRLGKQRGAAHPGRSGY